MSVQCPATDSDPRPRLISRLFILGVVNFIVSVISLVIGIVSLEISEDRLQLYTGMTICASVVGIVLFFCPCYMYFKNKYHNSKTFGCCLQSMLIWSCVALMLLPSSIVVYGIVDLKECIGRPEGGRDFKDKIKIVGCVLTILVSTGLLVVELFISFTLCCNARKLGIADSNGRHQFSYVNARQSSEEVIQRRRGEMRQVLNSRMAARNARPINNISNTVERGQTFVHFDSSRNRIGGTDESHGNQCMDTRFEDPPPSYEAVMRNT